MSQTDRIVWQYILSRDRISVRPSIFFYTRKTSVNYRECRVSRIWLLNEKGRNAGLAGDRSTVSGKHTRAFNGHSTDRLSQHDENNKSKRRQREFIHSRLENVVWELLCSLCVCMVCVKINNDELFCNAFPFENS